MGSNWKSPNFAIMTTFNYLLFDYDGTLCHTRNTINHAMEATFREYKLDVPDEKVRLQAIGSGMTIYNALVWMHPEGKSLSLNSVDAMYKIEKDSNLIRKFANDILFSNQG